MQKRYLMVVLIISLSFLPARAREAGFVETSQEMVDQMLGGGDGVSRSFQLPNAEPETRAIRVQRSDNAGREETVLIKTTAAGFDLAARLKVEFDVNSTKLRPAAYKLLKELGQALVNDKIIGQLVCIKGHTDSDGAEDYNLRLSFGRAAAVRAYLEVALGISGSRLQVFGYGESVPLAANDSPAGKQINRRVEVSLNCAEMANK